MKKLNLWLIAALISTGCITIGYCYSKAEDQNILRNQAATIARQELVIDSLRNPVDTTEFLTEHSELVKGD